MAKGIEKRLYRSEVPVELTWNLDDLFASDLEWEKELKVIEDILNGFKQYKGLLHTGSKILLHCLLAQEELFLKLVKASTYVELKQAADGTDPVNQANTAKFSSLYTEVNTKLSFIDSEILSLDDGTIENYLMEEPELEPFRRSLLKLLQGKKYRLSKETEEALAALGELQDSPYQMYQMAKLADMQFAPIYNENGEEHAVSFALFENRYEFSENMELRRKAYQSFVSTLKQYKNTIASAYSTEVKKQVALSRLRKYESVTHMLLKPQQVTIEMYHNQLDIIFKELAPHMRRYATLKKRVLGLEEMLFCDLKAPFDPDFNPKTTFEEASHTILEAIKVMGTEYRKIIEKGLKERWVDLADNIGKSTGAFCSSPYGAHPYILTTWQDNMRSAFTLAHEFGHAGHFYLANHKQRIINVRPSTYFVEAPSTLNELLLGQYLLSRHKDLKMRRWIITQLLSTYYHNFVTHLLEGEYQRRVYTLAENGEPLTAKTFSDVTSSVLSEFWGDTVKIDEGASLTWMRQPHYYMGLYPYTYSAGLTVSTAVVQMIQQEGKPAVDRWLRVLRAGGTLEPLELIKLAGVDMTKTETIQGAISYVGKLIDELEASYQK